MGAPWMDETRRHRHAVARIYEPDTRLTSSEVGDSPPRWRGGQSSSNPTCRARLTAIDREEASSLRYTACACVFTVLADTWRRSAISRKEKWLGRNRRTLSSAVVSDDGSAKRCRAN